ncbi:hypothetical protein VRU48_14985 [Pedobacter sp. KR3-3]|uniref:Uncharacterized protein n=1 Tax=Pedobacter albus TaxID=3113905 RepID=A0ABU7IAB8_9SPHI|nr:hypothetical protein [Pedobacter sp. KR3-3]MEE1946427.1 hypothetical protein [Pedobacter sp. KR3-3]
MKKFSLLLAAAAVLGVGSAFATMEDSIYVQTAPGTFELKTLAGGTCEEAQGKHCEYRLKTNGDPSNPNDFTPIDVNAEWQP